MEKRYKPNDKYAFIKCLSLILIKERMKYLFKLILHNIYIGSSIGKK